jgi:hypothetical protein
MSWMRALLIAPLAVACQGKITNSDLTKHHDPAMGVDAATPGNGDGDGDGDTAQQGDGDATHQGDGDAPARDGGAHDAMMPAPVDAGMHDVDAHMDPPPKMRMDGADQDIALFSGADVHFNPDTRTINLDADLPSDDYQYREIRLAFALRCPSKGCDPWDRQGHISIMRGDQEIEIMRFMTPYGIGMSANIDVTDLRPLLTGHVTARVFIDTWVNPGWLVDATLQFRGGSPPHDVLQVVPLWLSGGVVYGDPGHDPKRNVDVDLPAGATGAQMRTIITGHGQGNLDNCAEFCPREHTLTVGGRQFKRTIWRDDCASTAVPNQGGTWKLSRAGWCPGADVRTWVEDVSSGVQGNKLTVSWEPSDYENSCRPGVASCQGCSLGTGCSYDTGNHTEPYYQLSGLLVVYR